MSTQLRLIGKADPRTRPLRGRAVRNRRSDRRAAHWHDHWRLDARTRAAGLAGVASARAALAKAHQDDVSGQGPTLEDEQAAGASLRRAS